MRHNFLQFSQCLGSWLHRFEIKEEYEEGVKEVCLICGKTKFFRLIEGKLNNNEYMGYHYRQIIPPIHPLYFHEREFENEVLTSNVVSQYV